MLRINHKIYVYFLILVSALQFYFDGIHTAFEWTTTQDIPSLLRLTNPDFLKFDFYTNAIANAPRHVFLYSIFFLQYFGLDWYSSVYFIKVFLVLSIKPTMYLAAYKIIVSWANQSNTFFVEYVKFALFFTISFNIISNQFKVPAGWDAIETYLFLSPMTLSSVFGLLYIGLSFNNNNIKSIFVLGILALIYSTLLHPIVGLSIFLIKLIFLLPSNYRTELKALAFTFSIGVILPILLLKLTYSTNVSLSSEEFIKHYVFIRHPHHYKMSEVLHWQYFVWCFLFFVPIVYALFKNIKNLIILSTLCFLFFTGPVLLQYIGTELAPLKIVAQLGPSRFTIFTPFVLLCEISIFFLVVFNKKHIQKPYPKKEILGNVKIYNFLGKKYFITLHLFSIFLVWKTTIQYPLDKASEETNDLLTWTKNNTALNSVFIVPNNTFDTFILRTYGERAVFSDVAFPFNESYMQEFSRRLALINRFNSLRVSDFKCLYDSKLITHILVTRKKSNIFKSFEPVFQSNKYLIYDASLIVDKGTATCDVIDYYMNYDIQGDIFVKQKFSNYSGNTSLLNVESNPKDNETQIIGIDRIELGNRNTFEPCGENLTEVIFCSIINNNAADFIPVVYRNALPRLTQHKSITSVPESGIDRLYDDKKILWSELNYSASLLFLTFSANIQFSKSPSAKVIPILLNPTQSKLPKTEQTYLLTIMSDNYGRKSHIDFWFDNDLTALQRMQLDTGHKLRRNTDRFLYNGLYQVERKPNDIERNLPPHEWNNFTAQFVDLKTNLLMQTITDEIVIFFALSASNIEKIGDKIRFLAYNKNQLNIISAEVKGVKSIKANYDQEQSGEANNFDGKVDALKIEITAKPFDNSPERHEAKIFGLNSKLVVYMNSKTRLILKLSTEVKFVGTIDLKLDRVRWN